MNNDADTEPVTRIRWKWIECSLCGESTAAALHTDPLAPLREAGRAHVLRHHLGHAHRADSVLTAREEVQHPTYPVTCARTWLEARSWGAPCRPTGNAVPAGASPGPTARPPPPSASAWPTCPAWTAG